MSKQPWWQRFWHLAPYPVPAPRPVRPSPQALARAAGWDCESAGAWSHETMGVVERGRDGKWQAYTDHYDCGGFPTMLLAMEYAAEQAEGARIMTAFVARHADAAPPLTVAEMEAVAGLPREVPDGFIADRENCEAPIMEGEYEMNPEGGALAATQPQKEAQPC